MTLWDQSTQSSLALLDRWVRDGPMVGMKLAGTDGVCSLPVHNPCISARRKTQSLHIHPCLAAGWGDPALGGGKPSPDESKPQDVATLARRYPTFHLSVFILEGTGSRASGCCVALRMF